MAPTPRSRGRRAVAALLVVAALGLATALPTGIAQADHGRAVAAASSGRPPVKIPRELKRKLWHARNMCGRHLENCPIGPGPDPMHDAIVDIVCNYSSARYRYPDVRHITRRNWATLILQRTLDGSMANVPGFEFIPLDGHFGPKIMAGIKVWGHALRIPARDLSPALVISWAGVSYCDPG